MSRDMKENNGVKRYCNECGEVIRRNEDYTTLEVYDSPWDKPKEIYVHVDNELNDYGISCREALYDEHWADFRYFDCPMCDRTIIRQCPTNGWHSYVRITDEGEEICLRCYEEEILEHGIPREKFEQHTIAGMFFNQEELRNKGWEQVIWRTFLHSKASVQTYCEEAIQYIDDGYKVITDYERLGLGGGEGYVSLWVKRNGKPEDDVPLVTACRQGKEGADHGRVS